MNWRAIIFSVVALASPWLAHSQYTSVRGQFEVDETKGCAPFTVTVTVIPPFFCDSSNPCAAFFENSTTSKPLITPPFTHTYTQPGVYSLKILMGTQLDSIRIEVTDNVEPNFNVFTCGNNEVSVQLNDSNYEEYIVNFNDGNPEQTVGGVSATRHIYAPGTQTVTVRGRNLNAADNCDAGGVVVTPLVSLPAPTITTLQVVDNGTIDLTFNALPNIQYKLGIATNAGSNFQQLATLYNTSTHTVTGLRTDDNYYCFQLAAFDPCNNAVIASAVICSSNLDLNMRDKAVDVTWTTSGTGISNYSLTRIADDGTTLVTQPGGSPAVDTGIQCGTEYCYQLTSVYTNGSRSISMQKCGVGFSTEIPTPIRNITAHVDGTSVLLTWQTDSNFTPAEFTIERSVNGQYKFLATTTQHAFADPEYTTEDATCYRIRFRDVCDNESPQSIESCPIRLTGNLLNDNSINLSWTPYTGWQQGVAGYTILKYADDGTLLATYEAGTATSYIDVTDDIGHQTSVYAVRANGVDANVGQSISNRVTVLKDPNIFHPTAFTPNGDNLNDNFTVFGQYVVGFEMKIFNRWGELLFTTTDIASGWDGTYKGNEMPEGTYTFIAHITDRAGRTFKRSGSVLLLRRY